jgi:hypothetical protein
MNQSSESADQIGRNNDKKLRNLKEENDLLKNQLRKERERAYKQTG